MNIASSRAREIGAWVMLNALWLPLTFQDTALMTIAVPAATIRFAPANHVFVLSVLASIAALAAMLVPPLRRMALRCATTPRRLAPHASLRSASLIDVGALVALAYAHSLVWFAFFLVLATIGRQRRALRVSGAACPRLVPRRHWGAVSGVRGATTLAGTVLGFAIAGAMPDPQHDVSRGRRGHGARRSLAAWESAKASTTAKSTRTCATGTISWSSLRRARSYSSD